MGKTTGIGWCDATWSPWRGCSKVSPGCTNCYAETLSHRNPAVLGVWGDRGTRVVAGESGWREPLKWDREARAAGERRRVFPSLCDPFEDRPELEAIRDRFFGLILATPHLDWLVLTKRPENVRPYFDRLNVRRRGYWHEHAGYLFEASGLPLEHWKTVVGAYGVPGGPKCLGDSSVTEWPLPNVWLGVSVENQRYADERIPALAEIPAAVRWVSYEPALGPADWSRWINCLDWVVCGGESGPGRRPCEVAWFRDAADQCRAAGVACYVKQDAGPKPGTQGRIPDDLWSIKEFPAAAEVAR